MASVTLSKKKMWLGPLIILFAIFIYFLLPPSLTMQARHTLPLFFVAGLFWAFEIIPLYATSISLVVLLTLFSVGFEGSVSATKKLNPIFLSQFSNSVIFLFFGGLVLAKALQRHKIDQYVATWFFCKIGTKPFSFLAGHLFLSAFLSMWISNTAATAIVLSLLSPLLSQIPEKDPLRKSLPIAVAFGASIGGMATPIGTPPNALAIGFLLEQGIEVSFLKWMGMALPLTLFILILSLAVLLFFSRPNLSSNSKLQSYSQFL